MTQTSYPTITLRPGKDESLMRFHPWVFSGAIASMPDGIEEGDIVRVAAADGRLLGTGHYQIGSIAVRMLTSDADTDINGDFYLKRLTSAWQLRRTLGLLRDDNDAFRV